MDVLPLQPNRRPPQKLVGLDWVRAAAALGVVFLHACVPYARQPMPGLAWPVRDGSSEIVNWLFWSVELFIMPLFLFIAGFLAFGGLKRRSGAEFLRHRARRLLVPLLFGILVILPLDLHIWVLGWVVEDRVPLAKLRSFKFDGVIDQDLWGTSHLWFLQYLFTYLCLLVLAESLPKAFSNLRPPRWSLRTWTVLLAGLGSLVLFFEPEVVWGFQHSYWPVPSKWTYSGLFFVMGVMFAHHDGQLDWLKSIAPRLWLPGLCAGVGAMVLGRWHLAGGDNQIATLTLAVATCGGATLLSCAMIGTAVGRLTSLPVSVQYLAAASFWIYIVHHPLVALVHVDLKVLLRGWESATWITGLKVIVSFSLATGLAVLTYEGFVRKTRLGRWLGFQWSPPQSDAVILPMQREAPQPQGDHRTRAA